MTMMTWSYRIVSYPVQSLLSDPNPASPANAEASQLYERDRREYNKRVRVVVEASWMDEEDAMAMDTKEHSDEPTRDVPAAAVDTTMAVAAQSSSSSSGESADADTGSSSSAAVAVAGGGEGIESGSSSSSAMETDGVGAGEAAESSTVFTSTEATAAAAIG